MNFEDAASGHWTQKGIKIVPDGGNVCHIFLVVSAGF